MPLYEFKCEVCGKELEVQQKSQDPAPYCNHDMDPDVDGAAYHCQMKKLISKSAFQLKGKWAKEGY